MNAVLRLRLCRALKAALHGAGNHAAAFSFVRLLAEVVENNYFCMAAQASLPAPRLRPVQPDVPQNKE